MTAFSGPTDALKVSYRLTDGRTDTQTDYSNPRYACAPRVNESYQARLGVVDVIEEGREGGRVSTHSRDQRLGGFLSVSLQLYYSEEWCILARNSLKGVQYHAIPLYFEPLYVLEHYTFS